jgi:hypothetical protein
MSRRDPVRMIGLTTEIGVEERASRARAIPYPLG